jgi:hypothetical protein
VEEVTNVKVKLISIVSGSFKPKNGEDAIIKGDDIQILKADAIEPIKGLMYVTVMKADDVDTDGQFYNEKTVEKAAHDFLKNGLLDAVDENHDLSKKSGVSIVESHYDKISKAWKATIDFHENTELMQKAESNDLHGVSIYGVGNVIKKASQEDKGMFAKVKEYIDSKLNISKGENVMADEKNITKAEVAELVKAGVVEALAARDEADKLEKANSDGVAEKTALEERIKVLEKAQVDAKGEKDEGEVKKVEKGEKLAEGVHEW